MELDAPFFSQWLHRGSLPRTLQSAVALADLLNLSPPPSIGVVGSKGKGTTVAAATRALVDAGLKVVSVSSPSLRSNRERIRVNGRQISIETLQDLSTRLADLLPSLPPTSYLSPSGAFTMMGAWYAEQVGADILVIEEGMGGSSDEISLFDHHGLGVTPVFFEHGDILGQTPVEIARNLLGAGPAPLIVTAEQTTEVTAVIADMASAWNSELCTVTPDFSLHRHALTAANITTGHVLGSKVASQMGYVQPPPGPLNLPGRCSIHQGPHGTWLVDGAISPDGVRAALACSPCDNPTVMGCWPMDKPWKECADIAGAISVRTGNHLAFPPGLPSLADLDLDGDVIALGTQSFMGEVLDYLDVDTGHWF